MSAWCRRPLGVDCPATDNGQRPIGKATSIPASAAPGASVTLGVLATVDANATEGQRLDTTLRVLAPDGQEVATLNFMLLVASGVQIEDQAQTFEDDEEAARCRGADVQEESQDSQSPRWGWP